MRLPLRPIVSLYPALSHTIKQHVSSRLSLKLILGWKLSLRWRMNLVWVYQFWFLLLIMYSLSDYHFDFHYYFYVYIYLIPFYFISFYFSLSYFVCWCDIVQSTQRNRSQTWRFRDNYWCWRRSRSVSTIYTVYK